LRVNYLGCVENQKVNKIFSKYDLFFFLVKGESFGYVIPEFILLGIPVLIAHTSPGRNLKSLGIG